jgi:hypothetical protein
MVLLVIAPSSAHAQVTSQLTGYLEHQFSVNRQGDGWVYLDQNRLRADLNARAGRGVRMSAAVVWQLFRGDTEFRLQDILPGELFADSDAPSVKIENRDFLNHAYVSVRAGPAEVTAGKQYLTWGAAWVFNPTELFRPKDLFEPTYEREGVGAVSAKLPLADLSEILVAFVPEGGFETSGKLIRVRHHLAGFDLSALVAQVHQRTPPPDLGEPPGKFRRRWTVGGDLSGEIFGLGVWAEGTWSDHAGEGWAEVTLGGNYTLSDGTLLLVEGFYNGRGDWDKPYAKEEWLGILSGHRRTLGRGTVAAMVSRPVRQLWSLGASALANLGDGSFALIPSVSHSFAENVDFLFNGILFSGSEGTEYGSARHGGFLRLKVYF